MAAMGVFVALNWRLPGMLIALLGVTANLVVIVAHSGLMPISPEALIASRRTQGMELALEHPGIRLPRSKDVILAWEDTRLPWLSDMVVTPPVPRRMVVSTGDLIIAAGDRTVASVDDLQDVLAGAGAGELSLLVVRGMEDVRVTVPSDATSTEGPGIGSERAPGTEKPPRPN